MTEGTPLSRTVRKHLPEVRLKAKSVRAEIKAGRGNERY